MSRGMNVSCFLLAATLAGAPLGGGCYADGGVAVQPGVVVESEPPPPVYENAVYRPGYFWIGGRHYWVNNRWEWRGGRYEHERVGYAWEGGRWDRRGRGHVWVEGRWRRR